MLATRGKVPKRPRGARVLELDVKFIFLKVIPKAKFYNFLNKNKRPKSLTFKLSGRPLTLILLGSGAIFIFILGI